MSDINLFLRKKSKPKARAAPPRPIASTSTSSVPTPPSQSSYEDIKPVKREGEIVEIKLFSAGANSGLRYSIMKLNAGDKIVDPALITGPILMNRKQPGPKALPTVAYDAEGNVLGKYIFDEAGKPVLDDEGKPTVQLKTEVDTSLVGTAPGQAKKRPFSRATKEVYHQDINVIRLRREEANPWVLESGNPKEKPEQPEHWVGRMVEPSTMPTVLLVNRGGESAFTVVPLGRTYRFEPERPFKVLDPDAAHKLYERQAKLKIQDRWGQRQDAPAAGGSASAPPVKTEIKQEERALRMEQRIQANKGGRSRNEKTEKYEDDYKSEGRPIGRGVEAGVDEELDYDVDEGFQDDEDVNTFYRDENEEEDAKLQEERQKKEFRLANANVGDKPQLEAQDDDDDDIFGSRLTSEGKRLRKMMRKRNKETGSDEDMYASSGSDESESDAEAEKLEDKKKEQEVPPASEHPSRPPSRGPSGRGTSSPTGRRPKPPTPGKASTAPPGTGAALLAQRAASRGASPHRSRQGSPLNPENSNRGGSPTPGGGRGGSPLPTSSSSTSSLPKPAPRPQVKGKRKTTSESPLRETEVASPNKRKPEGSPSPSIDDPRKRKKKSGSSTPDVMPASFPTQDEVNDWFRRQAPNGELVPMAAAVAEFAKRLRGKDADESKRNTSTFSLMIRQATTTEPGQKFLRVRPELLARE